MGENTSLNPRTKRGLWRCFSNATTGEASPCSGAGVKRILVISYSFPPQKSPRAAQLFKLFRYLGRHPCFIFDIVAINPKLSPEKTDKDLALPDKNINIYYALGLEINYYLNYFIGRFFDAIVDGKIIWRFFALRLALKLLKANKYEAILTFSQPFSSATVGVCLKEKYPQIPLISYFSDPWTINPYFSGLSASKTRANEEMEKRVMELSDKVIFCSQGILDNYTKKYGETLKRKSFFIPHTYDLNLFSNEASETEMSKAHFRFRASAENTAEPFSILRPTGSALYPSIQGVKSQEDKVKIVHTGNFYGQRTPKNFLLAVKKLNQEKRIFLKNIEIYFYGPVTSQIRRDLAKEKLDSLAIWEKPVSYIQSLKVISHADILVSIDAPFKTSPFLPSKLIDYFGAQKPILAISPQKGAVADLISELRSQGLPYFLADAGDVNSIADVFNDILNHFEKWSQKKFEPPREFDIKNVGEKWRVIFLEELEKLGEKR